MMGLLQSAMYSAPSGPRRKSMGRKVTLVERSKSGCSWVWNDEPESFTEKRTMRCARKSHVIAFSCHSLGKAGLWMTSRLANLG